MEPSRKDFRRPGKTDTVVYYEVFAKDPLVRLSLHLIMNAEMGDVPDNPEDPDPQDYYWFGASFDESDQQP